MKLTLTILGILMITCSCSEQKEVYTIQGKTMLPDGSLVLLNVGNEVNDSAIVEGNTFLFQGKINTEFKKATLWSEDQYRTIWLTNEFIRFDDRGENFEKALIMGSKIQDQQNQWDAEVDVWDEKADSLRDVLKNESINDTTRVILQKQMKEFRIIETEKSIRYIEENPNYHLSALFLSFMKRKVSREKMKELFQNLDDNIKRNEWGKEVDFYLNNVMDPQIGDHAPDFTLPNLEGKEITLSSYYGNYLLLEFWANWCQPCRLENPNLLKAYKKYKPRGFEILGVNLDTKKEHWQNTIRKDSIEWITVSDLQGFKGDVSLIYNVYAIPKNLLLDQDGKVIAMNLRGEGLQNELIKIYGK